MEKVVQNFKSNRMQSLNMFRRRECFLSEFESLSGVWKFENLFDRAGPTSQRPTPVSNHACRHRSSSLLMTSRPYPMLRGGGWGFSPFSLPPPALLWPLAFALPRLCLPLGSPSSATLSNSVAIRAKEPHRHLPLKV
jgi:hypothetical protein